MRYKAHLKIFRKCDVDLFAMARINVSHYLPRLSSRSFSEICFLQQVQDFEDLVRAVVSFCSAEEQERLREMEEWIVKVDI